MESLFIEDEHVEELEGKAFTDAVGAGRAPPGSPSWLVLFYSPTCPHCQRYAPVWRLIGRDYAGSNVRIGAVDCVSRRKLCGKEGITGFPTVKAFVPGEGGALSLGRGSVTRENVSKFVSERHLLESQVPDATKGELHTSSHQASEVGQAKPTCLDRLTDAASSVKFALIHEIFLGGREVLSREERDVLLQFLRDAVSIIPSLQPSIETLLTALDNPVRLPNEGQWDGLIDKLGDTYWPAASKESSRSLTDVFSYNSGLWALFHSMALAEHPASRIQGNIVGFIRYFFSCEYCRAHFFTMLDFEDNGVGSVELAGDAFSPREVSLWVWRTHNAVTLANALAKDGSQMDMHKVLWPSQDDCQACRLGTTSYGQPIWDKDRVFEFLQGEYGCFLPSGVGQRGILSPDLGAALRVASGLLFVLFLVIYFVASRRPRIFSAAMRRKKVDMDPNIYLETGEVGRKDSVGRTPSWRLRSSH